MQLPLENGKKRIVFKCPAAPCTGIELPCGKCVGCRLEYSRQWAIRCNHEASLHENNTFLTLTYKKMPLRASLNKRVLTLFLKRLRKKYGEGIRFYACGEYGDKLGRPHYHLCMFNFEPPDLIPWKKTKNGMLYSSEKVDKLWGLGKTISAPLTFASAAYVARYMLKKQNGLEAPNHYKGKLPEFTTMSKKPGVGSNWLKKYQHTDVYDYDEVIVQGKKMRPPRYYDKLHEAEFPYDMDCIKRHRVLNRELHAADNTPERLAVRELVQIARLGNLPRSLDTEDNQNGT